MALRIPDWLRYKIVEIWECFIQGRGVSNLRERLNQNPCLIGCLTGLTILVMAGVAWKVKKGPERTPVPIGAYVWFYDLNTDELFLAKRNKLGPIETPSGPLPNGEPAGVRAHVYSYWINPRPDELFVGFLDKPDPNTPRKRLTWKQDNFETWACYRVIKRVDDENWVSVTSQAGQTILHTLIRPNKDGHTALYHLPK